MVSYNYRITQEKCRFGHQRLIFFKEAHTKLFWSNQKAKSATYAARQSENFQ